MSSNVGKIYPSIIPFYDKSTQTTRHKSRPVLIIAEPIGFDREYTVLPVSTISNPAFYNSEYDVSLEPSDFPLLRLNRKSYIRTHKQTTVYKASIDFSQCIGDVKEYYKETFYETLEKLDKFNKTIMESCG